MTDPTQAALHALLKETRRHVQGFVDALAAGQMDPHAFADRMLDLLTEAHARAVHVGRLRAGDRSPLDEDDRRFAEQVMRSEDYFLANFEEDLSRGRYTRDNGSLAAASVAARAGLYVNRLAGTANEAWALTSGGLIIWRLGEPETSHCRECPELAARSPYLWNALPTYPRAGETTCQAQCLCWLESASGQTSFRP